MQNALNYQPTSRDADRNPTLFKSLTSHPIPIQTQNFQKALDLLILNNFISQRPCGIFAEFHALRLTRPTKTAQVLVFINQLKFIASV